MNEITTNKTDTNLILQKLESTLPAVQKQISELCVSKDAHTTISDLQYSGQTPLIWVQQCALQQQQRLDALRETWFRHKKNEIRIKKWRDKGDELSMLKADEVEAGLNASKNVIRNAMEELQHYQDQIDALKKNFNIPDEVTPEMVRQNDKREKLRGAFRRALEEVEATGRIPRGTQESLEWVGVHPVVARAHCLDYLNGVAQMLEEGKAPTINHLYAFLDQMEELYKDGIENVVTTYLKNRPLDEVDQSQNSV